MFTFLPARWLAALPALAACSALAQQAPTPSHDHHHHPADAPALPYRSAFEGYRPYADDKPIPWREANKTVQERGGWRGYAQEAVSDSGKADPHAGHPMPAPAPKEQKP